MSEVAPLPHNIASSTPSDYEQDDQDQLRLSQSLNKAIHDLEALLSEALHVAQQAADEKNAASAEEALREAQLAHDDTLGRLPSEPPPTKEKDSPALFESRPAQSLDPNPSGLWTPGRKSSLAAPYWAAQDISRRPSAVPPSTTQSSTFPVANSARPRTHSVAIADAKLRPQQSSYPLFRPARARTPYPQKSPAASRRESHLVDPFSADDSPDTRTTSSSSSSNFSADVEDNVTVPARRSSRVHVDAAVKLHALSNELSAADKRPLMYSDDSSVMSSFPTPLRVNDDVRHIDWVPAADRRQSKAPAGKILHPGQDRRKSSIARTSFWISRGTHTGGTRPSAFRELVDRLSISGRGSFSAAVRASGRDGAASQVHSEDIALGRLSEEVELDAGQTATNEPTECGEVDTDAASHHESKSSRSRISLRGRRHVSFRGRRGLSFHRLHRRRPIARDWSMPRKRFVASVACINTAFVGLIVGIYVSSLIMALHITHDCD